MSEPGRWRAIRPGKEDGELREPETAVAQMALPELAQRNVAVERAPSEREPAAESKAMAILLEMFDMIQEEAHRMNRACFNQVVRFLADCLRIQPLPEEEHAVAELLLPLAVPYFEACAEDPWDWLGEAFEAKECGNPHLGQNFTPRPVVRFMVESAMLHQKPEQVCNVLDPCTGTGRFLVDVAARYRSRKLALYGVEIDLDLYRAALVNMRTFALGLPYFVLRADALLVDLSIDSSNWRFANLWDPPGWETHMILIGD